MNYKFKNIHCNDDGERVCAVIIVQRSLQLCWVRLLLAKRYGYVCEEIA